MGNQHSTPTRARRSSTLQQPQDAAPVMARRARPHKTMTPQPITPSAYPIDLENNVDGGYLDPVSLVYLSGPPTWSRPVVHNMIASQRLPPFHLGLEDWEDEWTSEEIVQAVNEAKDEAGTRLTSAMKSARAVLEDAEDTLKRTLSAPGQPPLASLYPSRSETVPLPIPSGTSTKEIRDAEAARFAAATHFESLLETQNARTSWLMARFNAAAIASHYKAGLVGECPVCFLNYPLPMPTTLCCHQPICNECFVQIKRADPTATHLEPEPPQCPFCMNVSFAVAYGQGENVSPDDVHPDWLDKVEALKATVQRRANRRVVFRNVNGQMVPVGITSSRIPTLLPDDSPEESQNGPTTIAQQIEDMMVMEAMRMSIEEENARQAKEALQRNGAASGAAADSATHTQAANGTSHQSSAQTTSTSSTSTPAAGPSGSAYSDLLSLQHEPQQQHSTPSRPPPVKTSHLTNSLAKPPSVRSPTARSPISRNPSVPDLSSRRSISGDNDSEWDGASIAHSVPYELLGEGVDAGSVRSAAQSLFLPERDAQ